MPPKNAPAALRPSAAAPEPTKRVSKEGLRVPQIRVLRVLYQSGGVLTRAKISERIGNKTNVVVGRAIGYSSPEKRAAFRQTRDGKVAGVPLLDLGYVSEVELDIDGVKEIAVEITEAGRAAYRALGKVKLGGLKDHWETARQKSGTEQTEPQPEEETSDEGHD